MTGVLWTSGVGMYLQGGKSMFMCTYLHTLILLTMIICDKVAPAELSVK